MPDLTEIQNSQVPTPQPELRDAEIFDDAMERGQPVRCIVVETLDRNLATDEMPWEPHTTTAGEWWPKKGERALLAFPPDGPPRIAGWEPGEREPDAVATIPTASASTITGTNKEGVSSSFARADHDHALGAGIVKATHLAAGIRNYGIVEALPTSPTPVKGDVCRFKAATGIYWELVYTGEATYPWAKIGGPPLRAQYTTGEGILKTSSETPQTLNAPSVTTPLAGEYGAAWGAGLAFTSINGFQARLWLYVNGAQQATVPGLASVGNAAFADSIVASPRGSAVVGAAKSAAVQARYARFGGSGEASFYGPYIAVDPLRVG